MINKLIESYRRLRLRAINRGKLRRVVTRELVADSTPVFFIFTSELVHMAPFCIPREGGPFQPVLVLNSVSDDDANWLRDLMPEAAIVKLTTSLRGNAKSMLAHAEVLNDLFAICDHDFCIQDPDCFVIDNQFWSQVSLSPQHYAGGPFVKGRKIGAEHDFPDTFFLCFNSPTFHRVCSRYGISASVSRAVGTKAKTALRSLGYTDTTSLEEHKDYFDTLQAYWALSICEGLEFKKMAGENEWVFHIGGTSYLHKTDYPLEHWDYWPLSVHYFNLRLLEHPALTRFLPRFNTVFNLHGSADGLLERFPAFLKSQRYQDITRILDSILPCPLLD